MGQKDNLLSVIVEVYTCMLLWSGIQLDSSLSWQTTRAQPSASSTQSPEVAVLQTPKTFLLTPSRKHIVLLVKAKKSCLKRPNHQKILIEDGRMELMQLSCKPQLLNELSKFAPVLRQLLDLGIIIITDIQTEITSYGCNTVQVYQQLHSDCITLFCECFSGRLTSNQLNQLKRSHAHDF